jgi:hypothetical protein
MYISFYNHKHVRQIKNNEKYLFHKDKQRETLTKSVEKKVLWLGIEMLLSQLLMRMYEPGLRIVFYDAISIYYLFFNLN